METSSNIQLAVPFFRVLNMEASLQFYVDKLGFTAINKWMPHDKIEWCWLQRDGVSIMLQELHNKEQYKETEKGKGVSICFQCKDALSLYHEFLANNINIQEPFVGNHMWVVCFTDPDGYCLDFESSTGVPEGTNYSEWVKGNEAG